MMFVHPYLFIVYLFTGLEIQQGFCLTFISQDFLEHSRVVMLAWEKKKAQAEAKFCV